MSKTRKRACCCGGSGKQNKVGVAPHDKTSPSSSSSSLSFADPQSPDDEKSSIENESHLNANGVSELQDNLPHPSSKKDTHKLSGNQDTQCSTNEPPGAHGDTRKTPEGQKSKTDKTSLLKGLKSKLKRKPDSQVPPKDKPGSPTSSGSTKDTSSQTEPEDTGNNIEGNSGSSGPQSRNESGTLPPPGSPNDTNGPPGIPKDLIVSLSSSDKQNDGNEIRGDSEPLVRRKYLRRRRKILESIDATTDKKETTPRDEIIIPETNKKGEAKGKGASFMSRIKNRGTKDSKSGNNIISAAGPSGLQTDEDEMSESEGAENAASEPEGAEDGKDAPEGASKKKFPKPNMKKVKGARSVFSKVKTVSDMGPMSDLKEHLPCNVL